MNSASAIIQNLEVILHKERPDRDADVMLAFPDTIHAKRFLLKVPANYAARIIDKNLNIYYKNPVLSVVFKDPGASVVNLARFPFFREFQMGRIQTGPQVEDEEKDERENLGHYIPIDVHLDDVESVVVPYKVFEHFVNKASNIVVRTCPCRERWACKDHSILMILN